MSQRLSAFALTLLVALPCAATPVTDLHAYWDSRCKECHGHAADFARRFLSVESGRLQGTHHRENLAGFLRQHYLSDDLVAPVSAMLMAQVGSTTLFRDKCAGCHGTAADFARKHLMLRDGDLLGAPSGRKVGDFLHQHGGLAPAEIAPMVESLKRVRAEVAH